MDETNIDKSLLLSTIIKTEMVGSGMGGIGGGMGAGECGGGSGGGELKEVRCSQSLTGSLLDVRVPCLPISVTIIYYFHFSFLPICFSSPASGSKHNIKVGYDFHIDGCAVS